MKTSSASAIFFFGATALAAPARYAYPYSYAHPSGSGSPYQYTTQTAAYPTGTAPCSTSASHPYQSQATPPYSYPGDAYYSSIADYPSGIIYPSGTSYPSGYLTGVYPTNTPSTAPYAHTSTLLNGPGSAATETLTPEVQVQWRKDTPHASGATAFGEINRRRNTEDIDTAVKFQIPASAAGKTCKLAFALPDAGSSLKYVGTPEARSSFAVYALHGDVSAQSSWADHVARGAVVGVVTPTLGQVVEVGRPFLCAEGAASYELVPVGSDAHVAWKVESGRAAGLVVEVY